MSIYTVRQLLKRSTRPFLILAICLSLLSPIYAQQPIAHPVANWIKSAVIYEINPRTFSTSGNFKGIESRLDSLNDLGVTVLWLMPIHPVGQAKKKGTVGSAYAVQDYYAINSAYGTKDDMKHFVAAAHQRGLKVIIDIVANHTAWDSVLIKQHPDWFKHDAQGNIIPPNPDWTDVAGLDYRNPQLRSYMTDMLKYWLRDFDLDGFRCDVAGEVPTDFWENARAELTKIKPDIIMLAEANKPELLVKAFDLDYAWPFHSTLTDVLENGKSATAIPENWYSEHERLPKGALEMRFSDDHDEKRAIVRFGERGALAASAIVFTTDGVPVIYNGQEAGDTTESTAPALFENMPVFWQISERRPLYPKFYKQLIALRKAHPALQQGETEWLHNSASDRVLTYMRRGNGEEFFVIVNTSNQPFTGVVDVPNGEYTDVTPGLDARKIALPAISLQAFEFRIYQRK
jgi:cyclomaltodextrinase / maltogenic alpha-amylase / neopullulanase